MLKNRPLLLMLVCAALGALVWYDNRPDASAPRGPVKVSPSAQSELALAPGGDATPATEAAQAAGVMQLANPLASLDKESLKDWVARPLFAPNRKRPPVVETATKIEQHAAVAAPSIYILLGIVLDGDRALALLRKRSDGKNFRVVVGDMIGGWRVAKIEPTTVVLENVDGSSQTMTLTR